MVVDVGVVAMVLWMWMCVCVEGWRAVHTRVARHRHVPLAWLRPWQGAAAGASPASPDGQEWWLDGLRFGCTGCGRCCKVEGDVWMNMQEILDVCDLRSIGVEEFTSLYVAEVAGDWVRLKDNIVQEEPRCVFLDDSMRCTIYEARPVQCRTYPFWPSVIRTPNSWLSEACVSDDRPGKHWNKVSGGCEGINHVDSKALDPTDIERDHQLSHLYINSQDFRTKTPARNKLNIPKVEYASLLRSVTKQWVRDYIIKFNLCPYAEPVFLSNQVRYRVSFEQTAESLTQDILREALALLNAPEDEVATTLIALPFGFISNFEEYYGWSVDLEETLATSLPRALSDSIHLVAFHPEFTFGGMAIDDPVHFEKRSPLPVINLLRADQLKRLSETSTFNIAEHNLKKLRRAAPEIREQLQKLQALLPGR